MKDFENVVVPEELQQLHQTMVNASSRPVARQAALAILKEYYYRYGKSNAIFTKALDSDEIILSYQFNLLVMDSICILTHINNTSTSKLSKI